MATEERFNWTAMSAVGAMTENKKIIIVCSRCRQKRKCGNLPLYFCWLQRTAWNYSKVRAARATRLFSVPPIKFLICGAVVADAVLHTIVRSSYCHNFNLFCQVFVLKRTATTHNYNCSVCAAIFSPCSTNTMSAPWRHQFCRRCFQNSLII